MALPGAGEDGVVGKDPGEHQAVPGQTKGHVMTEQQMLDIITETLGPNIPLTLDQLAALLMVLVIATMLLAVGLGYQIARSEKRIKALEIALAQGNVNNAKEAM